MVDSWEEHMKRVRAYDGTTCRKCGDPMRHDEAKAASSTPGNPLHYKCQEIRHYPSVGRRAYRDDGHGCVERVHPTELAIEERESWS